jgi:hypothetical protein
MSPDATGVSFDDPHRDGPHRKVLSETNVFFVADCNLYSLTLSGAGKQSSGAGNDATGGVFRLEIRFPYEKIFVAAIIASYFLLSEVLVHTEVTLFGSNP